MGFLANLLGSRATGTASTAGRSPGSSRFRCVQIHADHADCCAAVKAIAGRRFLTYEIPRLPLEACTREDCACSYELLKDRRSDDRRTPRRTHGNGADASSEDDRRKREQGRRSDD